jgi:hypothetical protein
VTVVVGVRCIRSVQLVVEVLEEAEKALPRIEAIKNALATLRRLAKACKFPASFDLAELRGYRYHSGVVFDAYCGGVTGAVAWPIGAVTDAQPRTVQHGFLPLGNCRIAARHNDLVPATQELMDESVHGRTAQSPWSARRHIGQMNEQLLGGHRATDPDPHRHDAPCGPRADGLRPASAMTAVMVPAPSRWRALSFRSPARA